MKIMYNILIKPIELLIETIFSIAYRYSGNFAITIVCMSFFVSIIFFPLMRIHEKIHAKKLDDYKIIFPMILQLPFLIAAYHFLANLELIKRVSLWGIRDISKSDALIIINGASINILPIIMTIVNLVMCAVISRRLSKKSKLVTYFAALILLVVLYDSSSAFVFYYTIHNLFLLLWYGLFEHRKATERENHSKIISCVMECNAPKSAFALGCVFLIVYMGVMVPSSVVVSAPTDFVTSTTGPIQLVINTLCVYIGVFGIYLPIYYIFANKGGKVLLTCLLWIYSCFVEINSFVFAKDLGVMNVNLVFDKGIDYSMISKYLNLAVALLVVVLGFVIIKKFPQVTKLVYGILIASTLFTGGYNLFSANHEVSNSNYYILHGATDYEKILPMSSKGKNVVVMMLDRCVNSYIPYIMEERADIKEQFDGFTYYPNTMGYGGVTHFASAALFGGYEYTPEEMNKRSDEKLSDKHNESLKMMPVLFANEGYQVSVFDPPLVNYSNEWDVSIFDEYEGISAHFAEDPYVEDVMKDFGPYFESTQLRNFVMYSFMKSLPLKAHKFIYDSGNYLRADINTDISYTFMAAYAGLKALPKITDIKNDDTNTFFCMTNSTTHEPTILQVPEYEPVLFPDNSNDDGVRHANGYADIRLETKEQKSHYAVDVLALQSIGKWFDYLRDNNAYDNTRIIIVSDHAIELNQFPEQHLENGFSFEGFHPVLLVKDFDAKGFSTCNDFMTNADVATLATDRIIEAPVNPFTGKPINNDEKNAHPQTLMTSMDWDYINDKGNVFTNEDGQWWSVKDDIFNPENWEQK